MKRIKMPDVYVVTAYTERSSYIVGYFANKADADKAAKGKGEWGGDAVVAKTDIDFRVYESYAEFELAVKNDKRAAALKKLSAEEIELLGVKA